MKFALQNLPNPYEFKDLLVSLSDSKPLSCDQLNFLYRHEKTLSTHGLDPVLNYYLKHYKNKKSDLHSFLLPSEKINRENALQLKKRLKLLVSEKKSHAQFELTPTQFHELKQASYPELILYHGNQFLTGAPFYTSGIPHVVFFQWGNLFGVVKYIMLPDEKTLKSNILIYVEDMEERYIDECVKEYIHHMKDELSAIKQQQLVMQNQPSIPQNTISNTMYRIPKLTLNKNNEMRDDD